MSLAWFAAAVLGGGAASEQRARHLGQWQQWEQALERKQAAAQVAQHPTPALAADAFDLARHLAPRIALSGGPGLALAPRGGSDGAGNQAIGIETRHFDARRAEPLENPRLAAMEGSGLAWLIAVLLPLALIAACHGVLLGDRDAGRWRWIASLSDRPWAVVGWALGWRAGVLWLLAALSSAVALGLDAQGAAAVLPWLAALAGFAVTWLVVVALVVALPISASGGTLALIGAWVLTTFALPAVLGEMARSDVAMPSRLAAIVDSRRILQDAETRNDELLADWYAKHANRAPDAPRHHIWPVSFVPRYLEIDRRLRPLMAEFDAARARQAARLEALAWLSPALSLIQTGNALAGHTAARHTRYARELERREDVWRRELVPAVMSYRGLNFVDFEQLRAAGRPAVLPIDEPRASTHWWQFVALLVLGCVALRRSAGFGTSHRRRAEGVHDN